MNRQIDSFSRAQWRRTQSREGELLGRLYEQALHGQQCWIRYEDGGLTALPVHRWLGGHRADTAFDDAVVGLCEGPTIELGCGPGRLVAALTRRGVPALGVDCSAVAIALALRCWAPALRGDVFGPLPGIGYWRTVVLADGNVGLGGDPRRVLGRAAQLLRPGGRCVAEFDATSTGVRASWVRLETVDSVGPWFRWASVGLDAAAALTEQTGLMLTEVQPFGARVLARLEAPA